MTFSCHDGDLLWVTLPLSGTLTHFAFNNKLLWWSVIASHVMRLRFCKKILITMITHHIISIPRCLYRLRSAMTTAGRDVCHFATCSCARNIIKLIDICGAQHTRCPQYSSQADTAVRAWQGNIHWSIAWFIGDYYNKKSILKVRKKTRPYSWIFVVY